MPYEIEVVELDPQPVASITTTTAMEGIGGTLGRLLPTVFAWIQRQDGVAPASPPFARYLEMGADGQVRLQAGIGISGPATSDADVDAAELPGGPAATTWHVGPYDALGAAHEALDAWCAAQGRTPAGAPWEVYVTDPGEEPDPSKWRTQVFLPLG